MRLLFDTADFPARWNCGNWTEIHGWTHIASDITIAAAYFAIPGIIVAYKLRRPDVTYPFLVWLFVAFILSCGTVHLVESTIFWQPWYRLSALFKVLTAIVSVITVCWFVRVPPMVLELPGFGATRDELGRSQATLRTVFDCSRNLLGLMKPDGTLIDANRTALQAAGVAPQDVLDQPFWQTIWWSHSQELQGRLRAAIATAATGQVDRFVATHPAEDGSLVYIDFSLTPVQHGGEVIALVPEGQDITQQRAHERSLRDLNEQLTNSNRELQQFAYLASHDLQEPLRTVANASAYLQQNNHDQLDGTAQKSLTMMGGAVARMQKLITDLLDYSRLGDRLRLKQVDTGAAVQAAREDLDAAIREASAEIDVTPMPTILADPMEMRLLFQNLLSNAVKFRSPERPLRVRISAAEDETSWRFSVADNGIGIDPAHRDRIFKIFQRLHPAKEYAGTGIGLAHCEKIAAAHGGSIRVEETPGGGSTFIVEIPKKAGQS